MLLLKLLRKSFAASIEWENSWEKRQYQKGDFAERFESNKQLFLAGLEMVDSLGSSKGPVIHVYEKEMCKSV